jgi:plasmid stabilization system protein ParE
MPSFVLKPEAELEFHEAYDWYELQRAGLGEEFARAVHAGIELICRHPEIFPVTVDPLRRALIRRFPFELIYEITAQEIVIYAVFHCSRHPERWRQRLT